MTAVTKYFFWIGAYLFSISIFGCRSVKPLKEQTTVMLPSNFESNADSGSYTPVSWRNLLSDTCLTALIDTALKRNYDLRSAFEKINSAGAELRFQKGMLFPTVDGRVVTSRRKYGDYTMDGVGNFDTRKSPNINSKQMIPDPLPDYLAGFTASWEADLWGKLRQRKRAAFLRFLMTHHGKNLVMTNLISEVASTYYQLMALDEEGEILNTNIALQDTALQLMLAEKEAGRANELAVELMTSQLLSSKAMLAETNKKIAQTTSYLSYLCGIYPHEVKRAKNPTNAFTDNAMKSGVPSDLLKNRPDILQAEQELSAASADLRAAKAAFYPSLLIDANMGLQSFNAALLLETPASLAYQVAGGLTAPLLNRSRLKSQLMAAKAARRNAYIQYEKAVHNGFREVYVSLNHMKFTKEQIGLKHEEVKILKSSVNTSKELFKAGRAGYLEIITSQKNALQAEIELVIFNRMMRQSYIDLYRSLGGGWK